MESQMEENPGTDLTSQSRNLLEAALTQTSS